MKRSPALAATLFGSLTFAFCWSGQQLALSQTERAADVIAPAESAKATPENSDSAHSPGITAEPEWLSNQLFGGVARLFGARDIRETRQQLSTAQKTLAELQKMYTDEHPQVKEMELVVKSLNAKIDAHSKLIEMLFSARTEVADQKETARETHGDQHPKVVRLEALLAQLDARIQAVEQTVTDEPSAIAAPQAATVADAQIKVLTLQYCQAVSTAELLRQLIGDESFRFVADERTNSIIAAGTEAELRIIEALLLRLDKAGTPPPAPTDALTSEAAAAKPTDTAQWLSMAYEISQELKKDQNAVIQLHGPNHPRVAAIDESIDLFKTIYGELVFVDDSRREEVWTTLLQKYVPRIEKGPNALRAERDQLIQKNNTDYEEQILELDFLIAWATVQKRYNDNPFEAPAKVDSRRPVFGTSDTGVREVPIQELQQQLIGRRKDYADAESLTRLLANQLKQSPNVAKKAELRNAVQNAFKTRQSLLRAELTEMQSRLLRTQRSIDMRERIADQIVDRRVEDLLNPQLEWENSSNTDDDPELTNHQPKEFTPESDQTAKVHVKLRPNHNEEFTVGDTVDVEANFPNRIGQHVFALLLEQLYVSDTIRDAESGRLDLVELKATGEQATILEGMMRQAPEYLKLVKRDPRHKILKNPRGVNNGACVAFLMDAEPKWELLIKLQGSWALKGLSTDSPPADLPEDLRVDVEIEHDLMRMWVTANGERKGDVPVQLKLGEDGPPQQIDLIFDPNGGDQRMECHGIVEIRNDVVRICFDNSSDSQRPEVFAVGQDAVIWELHRAPPAGSKAAVSDRLQSTRDVQQNFEREGKEGTVSVKAVVAGNPIQMRAMNGSNPMSFDLHVGSAGTPQQQIDRPAILIPDNLAELREATESTGPQQSEAPVYAGIIEVEPDPEGKEPMKHRCPQQKMFRRFADLPVLSTSSTSQGTACKGRHLLAIRMRRFSNPSG